MVSWERLQSLFAEVMELDPQHRRAFLEQLARSDAETAAKLEGLVLGSERADELLVPPSPEALRWLFSYLNDSELEQELLQHAASADEPVDPEMVGRYRIIKRLGSGGMGLVYLASEEEPVRRHVALKLLRSSWKSREVLDRFHSEFHALTLMHHHNISHVYQAGVSEDGRPYFTMEYIEGISLIEYCDKNRCTIEERLHLFLQVCEGVFHAHQKGIIHRDLKPGNILVTLQDNKAVPKIIDFGIAKAIGNPLVGAVTTRWGTLIGTPAYMSPEQVPGGTTPVDTRSDIYALGTILYELLTGCYPFDVARFEKASLEEQLLILRTEDAIKPGTALERNVEKTVIARQRATTPSALQRLLRREPGWIVLKALEKDPAKRYQSVMAFSEDLTRFLHNEPVSAGSKGQFYYLSRFIRRNLLATSSLSAIVLLLVINLIVVSQARIRAERLQQKTEIALKESQLSQAFLLEMFKTPHPTQAGHEVNALELLHRAEDKVASFFEGHEHLGNETRFILAQTFYGLGFYVDARRQCEEILKSVDGEPQKDSLKVMGQLAQILKREDRLGEAWQWYDHIREKWNTYFDTDDPDLLQIISDYAGLLVQMECVEEAHTVYWENYLRQKRVLGSHHIDLAGTLAGIGNTHLLKREFVQAERSYQAALDIHRMNPGENHPKMMVILNQFAQSALEQNKNREAERRYRDIWQLRSRSLGERHPQTLKSAHGLVRALIALKRHDEAEPLSQFVIESRIDVLGHDHPETLRSQINHAVLLIALERHDEAVSILEQILPLRSAHNLQSQIINNLADSLTQSGRYDRAIDYLRSSPALTARSGAHISRMITLVNLGQAYQGRGELQEAECFLRTAVDDADLLLPFWSPITQMVRAYLGNCLTELGSYKEAEHLLWTSQRIIPESHLYADEVDTFLRELRRRAGKTHGTNVLPSDRSL